MPKYAVTFYYHGSIDLTVDADDPDQARAEAEERLNGMEWEEVVDNMNLDREIGEYNVEELTEE